jgi:hypothetical protein
LNDFPLLIDGLQSFAFCDFTGNVKGKSCFFKLLIWSIL